MLEKINKIDWKGLRQAYGDADHVPEAIKGLIFEDEQIRERSYWLLDNYVVLQSDLHEAALYVVPFLLEILASDVTQGRDLIYDLLFEIGNGYAPPEVVCRDFSNELVPLQKACRNAVLEGVNIYFAEIKDKHSVARSQALELLASLEERADIVRETLKELVAAEEGEFHDNVAEVLQEMA